MFMLLFESPITKTFKNEIFDFVSTSLCELSIAMTAI